jgi:DNA-binding transcriptional LysR family regulator
MDVRELRYFAAVYQERNLTAGARRCFVSQPSVSAAIAGLETELDTKLFIRHKKGVSPTASADRLYPVARRMVDELETVRMAFRTPAPRRDLTIGLMRTLDIPRTLDILKPATATPDLHLRLVDAGEACDARIISKSMLKKQETFISLWTERYVVALPPTHPLTLKPHLRAADLAGLKLIDRCHCENRELVARARSRFETVAIAQSEEWALALVAAGVGVAILPEGIARPHPNVVVRDIVDADVTRQVGLAYAASPSTEVRMLIEALRPRMRRTRASVENRVEAPPAMSKPRR